MRTQQHTTTHLRIHNLKKGVSENEAPGPVGAYTTTHNNTPPPMLERCRVSFTESHSTKLIHRISFTDSHSPNRIHRTEIRISLAGCRGCIGRRRHPETHTHTHTHTHLQVHNQKKGVSENEAPGPEGAHTTTTQNNTPTQMPDHGSKLLTATFNQECSFCREESGL